MEGVWFRSPLSSSQLHLLHPNGSFWVLSHSNLSDETAHMMCLVPAASPPSHCSHPGSGTLTHTHVLKNLVILCWPFPSSACPALHCQVRPELQSPPKKPQCLLGTIQIPKVLRALHHSLSHLSFTRLISQPSIQDKVIHLTASKHTGSVLSLSSLSLHLEWHSFSYPFLKLPLCLLKSYL